MQGRPGLRPGTPGNGQQNSEPRQRRETGSQMLPKIACVVVDPALLKEFWILLLKGSFPMALFLPFKYRSTLIAGLLLALLFFAHRPGRVHISTPIPGVPGRKRKRRPYTPGYDSDTASR